MFRTCLRTSTGEDLFPSNTVVYSIWSQYIAHIELLAHVPASDAVQAHTLLGDAGIFVPAAVRRLWWLGLHDGCMPPPCDEQLSRSHVFITQSSREEISGWIWYKSIHRSWEKKQPNQQLYQPPGEWASALPGTGSQLAPGRCQQQHHTV